MRATDTWVCVADNAHAHIFRCDGPGRNLEPVLDCSLPAAHGGSDCARMERLAVRLRRAADSHLYEHLVLVAPFEILNDLKGVLGSETLQMLVGEIDKNLVKATPREVACHVRDLLPH
ncbi:MAG: host attachment protein [Magnetospirillum sp.]|nr:host attachment protein [Magnetospirillum sp.]